MIIMAAFDLGETGRNSDVKVDGKVLNPAETYKAYLNSPIRTTVAPPCSLRPSPPKYVQYVSILIQLICVMTYW